MARFTYPAGGGGGGDVSFTGEGCIVFPNDGEICNVPNSSGDGFGYSTIQITPDMNTNDDRYIIIDPTGPNHIHIRAGGTQDASTSELILGGERNKVAVSDSYKSVAITTAATITNTYVNAHEADSEDLIVPETSDILIGDNIVIAGISHPVTYFSPDPNNTGFSIVRATGATFVAGDSYTFVREEPYEHTWTFASDGTIYGPAMGLVKVQGIYGQNEFPLTILGPESVLLDGDSGEFLNDASVPSNQIATIGDIANTVSDVTSYSPVWSGTGLAFTGTPAVGSYVKVGSVVTVQIDVEFDNVSNFGTGQYSLTLPFNSRYHTDVYGGSVHKVGVETDHYSLKGHLSPDSSTMTIWSLKSSAQDEPFDNNSPVVLTTADKFHMSFTYICE